MGFVIGASVQTLRNVKSLEVVVNANVIRHGAETFLSREQNFVFLRALVPFRMNGIGATPCAPVSEKELHGGLRNATQFFDAVETGSASKNSESTE